MQAEAGAWSMENNSAYQLGEELTGCFDRGLGLDRVLG